MDRQDPPQWTGLTAPLWPIRYKPLPDELLSSWLVRLAHGFGLKVQTFCQLIFGSERQVWNRDIDRLAPPWLVEGLAAGTGVPIDRALLTTLRTFEGVLFPKHCNAGNLTWILSMKMYHRTREAFGQQYCPLCLRNDKVPFFRRSWRVALTTFCPVHHCLLENACIGCGSPVSFFRVDMGLAELSEEASVTLCFRCKSPLQSCDVESIRWLDTDVKQLLYSLTYAVHCADNSELLRHGDDLLVLRNLMRVLLSRKCGVDFRAYLANVLSVPYLDLPDDAFRWSFEALETEARHQLLVMGAWLMCDLEERLSDAVAHGAVRYSHLVRDVSWLPPSFGRIARRTVRRRLPTAARV